MERDAADTTPFPPVSYDEWRQRVLAELGGAAIGELAHNTLEGIPIAPLYAAQQPAGASPLPRLLRAPGPWRIWQEVPGGAGAAGREALGREVERDLGGVWIRAGDEGAEEALSALHLETLLGGLPLDRVQLAIEGAGEPVALAALLLGAARRAGADPGQLAGCLGCDPFGAVARSGVVAESGCAQLVAAARWATDRAPGWRAGLVSGGAYHDAGADAVQELAFVLATTRDYLRRLGEGGLSPDAAASQLLLSVSVGRDFYLQVAKVRALRLLGALALDATGASPSLLRIHARTSWRTRTRLDPATDLVRLTVEAMAAVVGGCDDLTCAPFIDPALSLELGLPLGSATQLLLRDEAGLGKVLDPAGGSWYVEGLTAELAQRAWELAAEIEHCGGMARALAVGLVARWVEEASERRLQALARRELRVTGITSYPTSEPRRLPHRPRALPVHPFAAAATPSPVPPLGGDADAPALLENAIDAAAAGAPLGALAAAMPAGGEPLRAAALAPWRDAVPFEALRRLSGGRVGGSGERLAVALLRLAPVAATLVEADLARQVMLAAGLAVREPEPLAGPAAAVAAWRDSGSQGAVLVPSRRTPADDLLTAAAELRMAGCAAVVAVARPPAGDDAGLGPHLWIREGTDALALLRALLALLRPAHGELELLAAQDREGA